MLPFVVLLFEKDTTYPLPIAFACQAVDSAHAEELAEKAHPGCGIVWSTEADDEEVAFGKFFEWLQT